MPKRVDQQARRRLIADALVRVASERGLESVSLRHVAAEAGVSPGMVQHYFRTKDEMLSFALEAVKERVRSRMEVSAAHLGPSPSPTALVRALLVEMLPVDAARRAEAQVALAFLASAAVTPSVAEVLRRDTAELLRLLEDGIRTAQDAGEAPADLDPRRTAATLLALMEGLGLHVLGGHYDADTALDAFDRYVAGVFGRGAGTVGRRRRRATTRGGAAGPGSK